MKIEIKFTELLATWGAILSTTVMVWNFVRGWRDRGRLKVDVLQALRTDHPGNEYLAFTATNVGRRPLLVKGWAVQARDGQRYTIVNFLETNLPKKLEEGEDVTDTILLDNEAAILFQNTIEFYAFDSKGRKWRAGRENLRGIRNWLRERAG